MDDAIPPGYDAAAPDPGAQRGMRIDPGAGGDYPLDKMTRAGGSGRRRAAQQSVHDTAGRLPPQALDVEQSVLGALLIDKDAFNRAVEVLPDDPFYDGRHQRIYAAVRALAERGDPVDLITLTQELRRRGDLDGAGGAAYLSELTGKVASAANVEYHARIVAERSLLRRFIETATLLVGKAYDPATDAFELLDEAEKDIFAISNLKKTNSARHLGDVVKDTLARLESISGAEGGLTGVPSSIRSLDQLTAGWQPSDLIIVAARPSMGKCLGKGTRVMLFDGTTKAVEDVQVGDLLMGDDSTPRRVLSLARGREAMVWVRQKHGMDYRVNASHILSLKKSRAGDCVPRGTVVNVTAREAMAKSPKWQNDHKGYKVAVDFPAQAVPIDPYLLGVWLGDGKSDIARIYTQDAEVVEYLAAYAAAHDAHLTVHDADRCPGYTVKANRTARETSLQAALRRLGVLDRKHIPHLYLANDRATRLALLAGLIDSDGFCNKGHGGTYEITLKDEAMARQVKFLCDTLGYRTSLRSKRASIRSTGFEGTAWRVRFNGNVDEIPVRIDRKKAAPWTDRRDWTVTGIALEPDGVDDYYGFTLDRNRLFLLEDGTVTHNTAFSLAVARNAALHPNRPAGVAYFSLEMSSDQLAQRLLTSEARVDAQVARTGRMSDVEWQHIARAAARLHNAPIFIDDTPGLGILELRAKCRRLKAEHDIGLIVVDYLQLMHGSSGGKNANREQEIAQISRSLKGLAKDLNVPVIALSQLSRAVESRPDKRPQLSDLRESGSIEQDADVVIFLHRPEKYGITMDDAGQSTEGIAEIIIGKQRNGPLGTAVAAFVKEYARFENLTTYYDGAGGYGNEPEDPFALGGGGAAGLPGPPPDPGYGGANYGYDDLPGGLGPPPGGFGDGSSQPPPYPPGDAPF